MVHDYKTEMSLEPINIPEVRKDNGRIILKKAAASMTYMPTLSSRKTARASSR